MLKRHPHWAIAGLLLLFAISPASYAKNSMQIIIDEYELKQCSSQLLAISEEVIGVKSHRLHMDQPKNNADKYPLMIIGVISYNDQDTHIQFTASPMVNGGCEVAYIESFVLPETCIDVREQVFKKWKYIGKLSDDSFFLRHKERLTKNATLTGVKNGSECLVSRRNSGI